MLDIYNKRIFGNGSFRELRSLKESSDLAKVLLEPYQKTNEVSMSRKCEESVTTETRKLTKVSGAKKDKVHRDQP